MIFNILLKLSIRNLFRHKTKNLLVVLMIMTGCSLFFIASSLEWNIRDNWRHYLSDTVLGDYYITSITGIGDDYRFFNTVPPLKFINKEIIDFLDRNKIQYSCRIRTGAKYYDEKLGFRDFNKFLGIDFLKEEKILSNILIYDGTFEPASDNGMDFFWNPSWNYQPPVGTNLVVLILALAGYLIGVFIGALSGSIIENMRIYLVFQDYMNGPVMFIHSFWDFLYILLFILLLTAVWSIPVINRIVSKAPARVFREQSY